jgi:hypothetical protein
MEGQQTKGMSGSDLTRPLSPRALVGFGWRRGLRVRGWLWGNKGIFPFLLFPVDYPWPEKPSLPTRRADLAANL